MSGFLRTQGSGTRSSAAAATTPAGAELPSEASISSSESVVNRRRMACRNAASRGDVGTVADHMTKGAVSLAAGDDLMLAATAFADHPHRVFPVLDQGRPVGMLRRSDVLAALLRLG